MSARAQATLVLSALLVALGVAVIVETAVLGGGIGIVLGVLLVLAGVLRSYLTFAARPRSSRARDARRRIKAPR
ncbi:MAG: hypothetical protein M3322_07725 [Actinomycetota bacterium]|nr:hypothetical protein [Actinomycetota bacterium]